MSDFCPCEITLAESRRICALEHAMQLATVNGHSATAEGIVKRAAIFEAYLEGEKPDPPELSVLPTVTLDPTYSV